MRKMNRQQRRIVATVFNHYDKNPFVPLTFNDLCHTPGIGRVRARTVGKLIVSGILKMTRPFRADTRWDDQRNSVVVYQISQTDTIFLDGEYETRVRAFAGGMS